ncbi:hypothetical protein I3760_13G092700 [Carya illinoinensis]|uniref:CCHC-type domain-containing protein n=1 Tax=Carya illinoinensis TaxID=32201 RepID=A0A922AHL4_CARIL|nr:hypothetical protein I3760_13G092700 [Carya illinoinensis]KAG2673480.1 hypothetical protein I3760_13G092700 [Carya illinoinensis]KAG6681457.1 hypothetical protein I3842_13G093400 [Carya illinoinensis]KAG6681458.1 hypothetical protein I3842_13G093400 [Carya illinoinensis]
MPATAGRVRMPANNRVHSSAALQTHGIWQSAIGYDPYAPTKDEGKTSASHSSMNAEPESDNAYASFQGLLALARITGSNANEARGACKKCGRVGHLTFQCRNFLSIKDDIKDKDPEAIEAAALAELDKLKGNVGKMKGKGAVESSDESDEEDSESSDSGVDSEIERIIAVRNGKKISGKGRLLRKKDLDEDESDTDSESKKRGRSKKRSGKRGNGNSDDSDGGRKKREKRRNKDESSDKDYEYRRRHRKSRKEKRRRRSHRHSDNSDSDASEDSGRERKRTSRRVASPSDSDSSGLDDSWVGRDKKRYEKKSRKRRHYEDA